MANQQKQPNRHFLLRCFAAGLKAVNGEHCTRKALLAQSAPQKPTHVIAIGKAACSMAWGAKAVLKNRMSNSLIITGEKYKELRTPDTDRIITGNHPIPGEKSCEAGQQLCQFLQSLPANSHLLFLISGGTSALVEHPRVELEELARINKWLLSRDYTINEINAVRRRLSHIKGGGLINYLPENSKTQVCLISDTPDNNPATIGSGLLFAENTELPAGLPKWILANLALEKPANNASPGTVPHTIIADNKTCREAIAKFAKQQGIAVHDHGLSLQGNAETMGQQLATELLNAPTGLHIHGGETTVKLPPNPGTGGRNQHFALAAAKVLAKQDNVCVLAAGTDGFDGNSIDTGAIVDGGTQQRGEMDGGDITTALQQADANSFLLTSGDLLHTGATGTNVMDIVLGLKMTHKVGATVPVANEPIIPAPKHHPKKQIPVSE